MIVYFKVPPNDQLSVVWGFSLVSMHGNLEHFLNAQQEPSAFNTEVPTVPLNTSALVAWNHHEIPWRIPLLLDQMGIWSTFSLLNVILLINVIIQLGSNQAVDFKFISTINSFHSDLSALLCSMFSMAQQSFYITNLQSSKLTVICFIIR